MGEMAAGIAHELNQPLSAIANLAFAAEHSLGSDQGDDLRWFRETMKAMCEQSVRAGDIVRRLRSFVNKTTPQRMQMNLNGAVRESLKLVESDINNDGVRVEASLQQTLPTCHADKIQIQQVLVNLIRNAIDAMKHVPRSQRTLTIATSTIGDDTVEVSV